MRKTLLHTVSGALAGAVLLVSAGCGPRAGETPAAGHDSAARLSESFPGRDPMLRWGAGGDLHVIYVKDPAAGGGVAYRRFGSRPAGPVAISQSADTGGGASECASGSQLWTGAQPILAARPARTRRYATRVTSRSRLPEAA